MASANGQTGTTAGAATKIDGDANAPSVVHLRNDDAVLSVFWGYASSVSTTTGVELVAGQERDIPLDAGDNLYVIAASGTPTVHWARCRQVTRLS